MGCKQSQPDSAYAPGVPPHTNFNATAHVDAVAEKNIRKAYDTGHLTHEEIHERIEQGFCQHSIRVGSSENVSPPSLLLSILQISMFKRKEPLVLS